MTYDERRRTYDERRKWKLEAGNWDMEVGKWNDQGCRRNDERRTTNDESGKWKLRASEDLLIVEFHAKLKTCNLKLTTQYILSQHSITKVENIIETPQPTTYNPQHLITTAHTLSRNHHHNHAPPATIHRFDCQ